MWDNDNWIDFIQQINCKFWDDTIETIKMFHMLKLWLWPTTKTDLELNIYNTYNWKTKLYSYKGIENIGSLQTINTLWDNNLWENEWEESIWYISNIEYDIWLTWEILNFNLKSVEWFELISFIIWYDLLQPHITEIWNVYLFNH